MTFLFWLLGLILRKEEFKELEIEGDTYVNIFHLSIRVKRIGIIRITDIIKLDLSD